MAFRQDQKNSQKQRPSLSPQLFEAVALNENSNLEIQDIIDLEILTDADLEEAPLKLGDDEGADEINLNESTVRRILKNKYVDTPHGIFELKFFFDKVGFDMRDGRRIASKGVKELIKKIIESENKAKPCSDRQISDMLRSQT